MQKTYNRKYFTKLVKKNGLCKDESVEYRQLI